VKGRFECSPRSYVPGYVLVPFNAEDAEEQRAQRKRGAAHRINGRGRPLPQRSRQHIESSAVPVEGDRRPTHSYLSFINNQDAAAGVGVLVYVDEGDDDAFTGGARFFGDDVGDALGDTAFLFGGAAFEECYLDVGHRESVISHWSLAMQ